ncbi:NAD(P)-dependent oxidoreductase [uncultured Tissierella sp.]|jgi:predicted homoserine dehydrogenase-like protein|uniref:NAD(P)H-dependent oxidoreductase n=1 Tax=uncultured Tissierella sp. TaxID=448160 RepID=UPI0028052B31|nr:NAD(P)-dependent oxidoreductase [uncultured Tissierella sp.]MDU5083191.1 NAD(P)-dependent oxidoreductase [Bacillota bacterium]
MTSLNNKLKELDESNKHIKVSIIGAGLMGKGLVSQMMLVKGMEPSLVVSNKISDAVEAYTLAGISKDDIVIARTLSEINIAMESNKYVVTDITEYATKPNLVDVVVDATGVPDAGARIALDSIENKKHIVMLNVEADVVVGPILNKMAKKAGVVYTGTAGDEPGSVKEIFDFAEAAGFEVLAIGKGKNNPIDYEATPDSIREKALKSKLNPIKLASFIDGTNTMVEMAAMANSTGFIPDIRGGYGPTTEVNDLPKVYSLKEEGGILNKYRIVDYAHGVAPGVFAIVTTSLPQVHHEMQFLKMGSGPNYVLYRPYHLTSLETPISIAKAYFYKEATIAPAYEKTVAEVITMAKKDLKKGERLDGIGEYTVLGSIDTCEVAKSENLVPIGLINNNAVIKRDIKKGECITYDMVDLDTNTTIYKLRMEQEKRA